MPHARLFWDLLALLWCRIPNGHGDDFFVISLHPGCSLIYFGKERKKERNEQTNEGVILIGPSPPLPSLHPKKKRIIWVFEMHPSGCSKGMFPWVFHGWENHWALIFGRSKPYKWCHLLGCYTRKLLCVLSHTVGHVVDNGVSITGLECAP